MKVYGDTGDTVHKWQSKVKKSTLTPEYNQDFTFDLADMNIDEVKLELVVKDKDIFTRDDFIGMVSFGKSVNQDSGRNHWSEIIGNPYTRITHWHTLA